jgi:hypothetical protein
LKFTSRRKGRERERARRELQKAGTFILLIRSV